MLALQRTRHPTQYPLFLLQVTVVRNVRGAKLWVDYLPFQQLMCLLISIMIRASRTPMNTANRVPPPPALLPKCRIRANRLCGSTIARSLSPMKKRRSSKNMPRRNPPSHQPPVKGNVESDDFRLLRPSLRDLTMLICMPAITPAFLLIVLSYRPPSCPSRLCHAQPHLPHNPQSKCLYYIPPCFVFCIAASFLYIRIIDTSSTVLSPSHLFIFPLVFDLAWLLRVWTW